MRENKWRERGATSSSGDFLLRTIVWWHSESCPNSTYVLLWGCIVSPSNSELFKIASSVLWWRVLDNCVNVRDTAVIHVRLKSHRYLLNAASSMKYQFMSFDPTDNCRDKNKKRVYLSWAVCSLLFVCFRFGLRVLVAHRRPIHHVLFTVFPCESFACHYSFVLYVSGY